MARATPPTVSAATKRSAVDAPAGPVPPLARLHEQGRGAMPNMG